MEDSLQVSTWEPQGFLEERSPFPGRGHRCGTPAGHMDREEKDTGMSEP